MVTVHGGGEGQGGDGITVSEAGVTNGDGGIDDLRGLPHI